VSSASARTRGAPDTDIAISHGVAPGRLLRRLGLAVAIVPQVGVVKVIEEFGEDGVAVGGRCFLDPRRNSGIQADSVRPHRMVKPRRAIRAGLAKSPGAARSQLPEFGLPRATSSEQI